MSVVYRRAGTENGRLGKSFAPVRSTRPDACLPDAALSRFSVSVVQGTTADDEEDCWFEDSDMLIRVCSGTRVSHALASARALARPCARARTHTFAHAHLAHEHARTQVSHNSEGFVAGVGHLRLRADEDDRIPLGAGPRDGD